jgi:hypothetical protein
MPHSIVTVDTDLSAPAFYPALPSAGAAWPFADPVRAGFEAHESPCRQDLRAQLEAGNLEPPPDNEIIGPVAARGAPNGVLVRNGKLAASWGDTRHIDMSFSVAKSYLSLLARALLIWTR